MDGALPIAPGPRGYAAPAQERGTHAGGVSEGGAVFAVFLTAALTELVATPSGGTPKAIVANLAPRKIFLVSVATLRSCVFTLRAAYADGASAELTNASGL
jgi:hypothetical protein